MTMRFPYGASADFDAASEALPGTRDARTLEVGARLLREFRIGVDKQDGTTRAGFKTGDIPMPASDRFPRVFDKIPLKPRGATKTEDKKTLAERLSAIVGFTYTDPAGTTYAVGTVGVRVAIKKTTADRAVSSITPASPDFNRTALMLLNAHKSRAVFTGKPKGMFKPSSQSGSSSGGGSGDQSGAGGDQSGQTGDQSGSQTPAWSSQPYIAEMLALVGFTGPDYNTPQIRYTVKKVTLDGYEAPAIDKSAPGPTDAPETTTITPKDDIWVGNVLNVLESKSKTDAGLTPSTSSTPGTMTVTTEMTGSEGSVWTTESVPSSDDALAQQAQATIDAAVAEAGGAGGAGGGAMTVSADGAAASGEGLLSKYKVPLIIGVVAVGVWYGNKQGWFK